MVNDNSLIVKGKKMKRLLIVGMMIALMLAGPALVVEPVKIGMITTLSTKAGYLGEEIRDLQPGPAVRLQPNPHLNRSPWHSSLAFMDP